MLPEKVEEHGPVRLGLTAACTVVVLMPAETGARPIGGGHLRKAPSERGDVVALAAILGLDEGEVLERAGFEAPVVERSPTVEQAYASLTAEREIPIPDPPDVADRPDTPAPEVRAPVSEDEPEVVEQVRADYDYHVVRIDKTRHRKNTKRTDQETVKRREQENNERAANHILAKIVRLLAEKEARP